MKLKKQFSLRVRIASLLVLSIMICCTPDVEVNEIKKPSEQKNDQAVIAQVLAKASLNSDVREFLKKEALKQFDEDFDILYQMIKDKEVREGITFENILQSYSTTLNISAIADKMPLLTIFIPDLPKFSVKTWDTSRDIDPLVAISDDNSTVTFFDSQGDSFQRSSDEYPDFPVMVIKENGTWPGF